ncbi:MAG: flagellar basal body-associated FliL family protein [Ignavibacterium sp.]|uniref:flagellar basal body-associated FliL family protein n=1 Tax=Ignavibacterium album TaxID=591197 RepID=UPI0026EE6690|nr:flagellar basal body-associated FliL family protein [Ignavibacterium album]MCA2004999.1 flagellar basal body-associated FliL family protein [Ignavibacterium sp.]MCX8105256.1 flagellar basal body-associated FliL family protein [Ignavibacterium album]
MKEEKQNKEQQKPVETIKKNSAMKPKLLIIGLPLFIVQLVAVYFITANILIPKDHNSGNKENINQQQTAEVQKENKTEENTNSPETESNITIGENIFNLEDIIVNPAETNGKTLALASLGFDLKTPEAKKTMEEKVIIVKDAVITLLSSKTVPQLSNAAYRDTLKSEMIRDLSKKLPGVGINNIYFSKFIIQ